MLQIKVTLRVFSTVHSLSDLSQVLGAPTRGFSMGDPGPGDKSARDRTYWAREASCPPDSDLEVHILQVISFLDDRADAFARIRRAGDVDLFCMLSTSNGQGGASLSHTVMRRLVAHELSIVFDVYSD
jgi:hypothetical protein